ncbi:hypothetical protein KUCAC02_025449 [Chaenocephalus aceratus]|uniref:Uncharacterized protein n=1 Tax=Chaenocephalus aceratus TaxID=36190 RepID=A0ACB9VV35_CHAAC|nr:hypothetical protein KUCAC02_025449 [Chaenocephalus aceratus]
MDWGTFSNCSRVNSSTPPLLHPHPCLTSSPTSSSSCWNSSHPFFSASPFSAPSFSGLDLLYDLKPIFIPLYSVVVLVALLRQTSSCSSSPGTTRKDTTPRTSSSPNLALGDLVMCIFSSASP